MRSYVEFVTTPTADTPGALLVLHFDDQRYLIGRIGEGTQRACNQRGIGLRKVTDVLLTGWTRWESFGGVLGIILTLADVKGAANEALLSHEKAQAAKPTQAMRAQVVAKQKVESSQEKARLRFYAAPNFDHLIGTARRFIFRTGMPLAITEHKADAKPNEDWSPTWTDRHVRVWAMSISPHSEATDSAKHPSSPRKRTFEEFTNSSGQLDEEYANVRRNVVNKMFGSDWRYDALVPMQLSQVKMPAALYVRDPVTKQTVPYTGPLPGDTEVADLPDITVFVREPWPGALTEFLPPTRPSQDAVSYIIRNHPQRGKFMPERATALNVLPKSLWNSLSVGNSVTNIDGRIITPDMVLQPGKEGGGFAVVDLPTVEHVKPLIARQEWRREEVMNGVGAIVWILGAGIATNPDLVAFQDEMKHLEHIMASPDTCDDTIAIDSAARSAMRYNRVDKDMFPVPINSNGRNVTLPEKSLDVHVDEANKKPGITTAKRGLRIGLEPTLGLEYERVEPPLDLVATNEAIDEELKPLLDNPEFNVSCSEEETARWAEAVPHGDVEIFTLGTGSSHPSLHRNVSGTLVRVPGDGSYLLDAGEGTLGTLKRLFNPEELVQVFKDLKVIWISHIHADHHLGLASIIRAWYQAVHNGVPARNPFALDIPGTVEKEIPLTVISDAPMLHWLAEYSSVEDFGYSRIIPLATKPCRNPAESGYRRTETTLHLSYGTQQSHPTADPAISRSYLYPKLGLQSFETVYVAHCKGAQGVSMTTRSGFKFSYSGDCRPNMDLATIGVGSHVLIHEATFEDQMRDEALAKRHSTAGEALVVATQMKAKLCLLTHFSQRYPTMPSWGKRKETKLDPMPPNVISVPSEHTDLMDVDDVQEHERIQLSTESSVEKPNEVVDRQPTNTNRSRGMSPEYHRLVRTGDIRATVLANGMRVITAFDYMRFKMKDVPLLEAKQPLLKEVCDQSARRDDEAARGDSDTGADGTSSEAAQKISEKRARKEAKQKARAKEEKIAAQKAEREHKEKHDVKSTRGGSKARPVIKPAPVEDDSKQRKAA